jgi:hypothetical protein
VKIAPPDGQCIDVDQGWPTALSIMVKVGHRYRGGDEMQQLPDDALDTVRKLEGLFGLQFPSGRWSQRDLDGPVRADLYAVIAVPG